MGQGKEGVIYNSRRLCRANEWLGTILVLAGPTFYHHYYLTVIVQVRPSQPAGPRSSPEQLEGRSSPKSAGGNVRHLLGVALAGQEAE